MTTTTLDARPADESVPIVRKHHWLVRVTHWLNIPFLLALGLSGLSIYAISPVYHHAADAQGNTDYFVDIGRWVVRHVPGLHDYDAPDAWLYNHFSLGPGMLATALRWHWFFAYLFMLNGLLYLVGLAVGGGWRSLRPRRADLQGAWRMQVYYVGLPLAKILRRPWPHPDVRGKYNALQKMAYGSMPIAGLLSVLTGWAIHKPAQLWWLAALFGGYDYARVWHFWLLWVFVAFVIPHVVLVAADGWDTFRSMVVGWSMRVPPSEEPPPPGIGPSPGRANSPGTNTTSTPPG
ncbi:MAG: cytochrome b/b6 domain-containing protein [Armatimonadetes bacterium]|nr:cytochrome b/b6 domain-containing protein [Armatimonadota bacterium]